MTGATLTPDTRPSTVRAGVVALDVGGTDMKSAVLDANGTLLDIEREPTPLGTGSAESVVDALAKAVERAKSRHPDLSIEAAGLCVPGLVDDVAGIGRFASNLSWDNFAFQQAAETRIGLPVAFGHDVRAAGRAERELGAARGYQNVAVVVIGTGIASTIIVDGQVLLANGYAGEIGHSIIQPGGDPCACGGRGHLEGIAAASAIARRYTAATGIPAKGSREVLERAKAGDAAAAEIWNDAVEALALGLSQIVSIAAPEVIVIGGGLAQAGDDLFTPLTAALDRHLSFQRHPRLVPASLGENAGLLGTALAARQLIPA
ncbi:MAG: ROK family protein [Rhodoglobus sp.]